MKIKDLSMTDLMAYNKATDALLSYYDNMIVINSQSTIGETLKAYSSDLLRECENKKAKCNTAKELIINEMIGRIDKLC